jgi:hypothetical protein
MATLGRFALATLVCAGVGGVLAAQTLFREGTEFQVNVVTADSQSGPSADIDADGDFVVVWRSKEQDGDAYGVFGRRFDASGEAVATEFQVNSFTTEDQYFPNVGAAADGSFVVVWESEGQDGWGKGAFGRRFDAAGVPLGTEFQLSLQTVNNQSRPVIVMQADGSSTTAWSSESDGYSGGIFARHFGPDGSPLAPQFQVNTYTFGGQSFPAIAARENGAFVVAWVSYTDEDDTGDLFAQRFDAGGAVGTEFLVNSLTSGRQIDPSIALDPDGGFVVVWRSFQTPGSNGLFARRFDATGTPLAVEFRVNTSTAGDQIVPTVAANASGEFMIVWNQSSRDGSGYAVFARQLDSAGALGPELQVNTYTVGSQITGEVVASGEGDFLVTWGSDQQDGSLGGIFAQRFAEPAVLDVDADGDVGALTDGLLVLRFLFGFTGDPLTAGAVGSSCQRCDAAAIESYLEGLT